MIQGQKLFAFYRGNSFDCLEKLQIHWDDNVDLITYDFFVIFVLFCFVLCVCVNIIHFCCLMETVSLLLIKLPCFKFCRTY